MLRTNFHQTCGQIWWLLVTSNHSALYMSAFLGAWKKGESNLTLEKVEKSRLWGPLECEAWLIKWERNTHILDWIHLWNVCFFEEKNVASDRSALWSFTKVKVQKASSYCLWHIFVSLILLPEWWKFVKNALFAKFNLPKTVLHYWLKKCFSISSR